jgi:hypothetical protein
MLFPSSPFIISPPILSIFLPNSHVCLMLTTFCVSHKRKEKKAHEDELESDDKVKSGPSYMDDTPLCSNDPAF